MSHLHCEFLPGSAIFSCASSYYAPEEIDAVVSVSCSGSKNGSLWPVVHAVVSLLRSCGRTIARRQARCSMYAIHSLEFLVLRDQGGRSCSSLLGISLQFRRSPQCGPGISQNT